MSDTTQYQGSQAFNHVFSVSESVVPNTGALILSKPLIALRGVTQSIDLNLTLTYMAGTAGILGLPPNWGFGLPYVAAGQSLTSEGTTSVIDPTWADSTGYQSGLRYVNDHGTLFKQIIPPEQLPSGSGTYSYVLHSGDGSCDYFDLTGKLVMHADLFGNTIAYSYTNEFNGVFGNFLDHIVDSYGQVVSFEYGPNTVTVELPDGSTITIAFSTQGVSSLTDAEGNQTLFGYPTTANQAVVNTIAYPTGLTTVLTYTSLSYLDANGGTGAFPAVSTLVHHDTDSSILDQTRYSYGSGTAGNTFTGFKAGYLMTTSGDCLIDSNNTAYQYDVLVESLDASANLLAASQSFFNYLHLPLRVDQFRVESGQPLFGRRSTYTYPDSTNFHARTVNYSRPLLTVDSVYSDSAQAFISLHAAENSYDLYGKLLTNTEQLYDQTSGALILQSSVAHTYVSASWGGQMPASTVYLDEVTGSGQQITFTLTPDDKNIANAAVAFRTAADAAWTPWKSKVYEFDSQGRSTGWTLTWAQGTPSAEGTLTTVSESTSYAFEAATATLSVSTTDPTGNVSVQQFDLSKNGAPMVKQTSPLGNSATFGYDALSRLVSHTDAEGNTTTFSYTMAANGGINSAVSTNPTGYCVESILDGFGRIVEIRDNGDPTSQGTAVSRTLRQLSYNAQGSVESVTDELGLVTTTAYDAYGRPISSQDPLGNTQSCTFDDAALTASTYMNGALRETTVSDGLGRALETSAYPDSDDPAATYFVRTSYTRDGLGRITTKEVEQVSTVPPDTLTQLSIVNLTYDAGGKVLTRSCTGIASTTDGLTETFRYDLPGNPIQVSKIVTFAQGTIYTHAGDLATYDACGRVVSVTNGVGQTETLTYDADGRLTNRVRYDGSTVSFAYNGNGWLTATSWDGGTAEQTYLPNGRVAAISDANGTLSYSYTRDGSLFCVTYPDGCQQTYGLDTVDRIVTDTNAAGTVTTATFDAVGRIATRRQGEQTLTYLYGTINHMNGQLVGVQLDGPSPTTWAYSYNGFGRQNGVKVTDGAGAVLLSAIYTVDAMQRLVATDFESADCAAANLSKTYAYDGLGQLVAAGTALEDSTTSTVSYAFDGNSNVLRADAGPSTLVYSYNAANQLQIENVVYDANGRMTADGSGRTYTYDIRDRLVSVNGAGTSANYHYHPDGSLAAIEQPSMTQNFYYTAATINATKTAAVGQPAIWTSFLFSKGERILATDAEGAQLLIRAAGSTTLVASAGSTSNYDYSVYGAHTVGDPPADGAAFLWNQELNDPASGLVYLRSRWYNPQLMAFMSPDPLFTDNRYGYCAGNPVDLADPTGESGAEVAGLIVGAIVGTVATVASGGLLGAAAAAIFGTECVSASIGATAIAGAVGSVAGDAANCGISGQDFTSKRALIDVLSGLAGGAAGAAAGGAAGRAAMARALAKGASQRAITNIGLIVSGAVGGLAGAAAASGVTSLAYNQPFFSTSTALNLAVGFAGGIGGGFLTSGAYLGLLSNRLVPVSMSDAELGGLVWAADQVGARLPNKLLAFAPQDDANATAAEFNQRYGTYESALTLTYKPNATTYDTIAAHGAGNTLFVTWDYNGVTVARPITGARFAAWLRNNAQLIGGANNGIPIKLMSCFGAFSNAQTIANALQRSVFAGYPEIDRYTFTNWRRFMPR